MALIETTWNRNDFIPRKGLEAWYAADTTASSSVIVDAAGKSPDLVCGSNQPVLTPNYINGQPAIVFNGTTHNPLNCTRAFTAKHVFTVGAYADASFPAGADGYRGLVTGIVETGSTKNVLVGEASGTKFFDFGPARTYRRRDVVFAQANMQAAMSNNVSLFEISDATGWGLDGVQIGRQTDYTNRRWAGPWAETLIYNRILTESERFQVLEYVAMKYYLWKQIASGLDVFPFQPNWSRPMEVDKNVLTSVAVSGKFKGRSKGLMKHGYELQFESRWPEEWDAAKAFWNTKHPGSSFIYRDDAFSPSRDTETRFISGLSQMQSDPREIDYKIQILEV